MPLRIIFMGTPEFSVPVLSAIMDQASDNGHEVLAVYTQPPRPAGRGMAEKKSPVHQAANQFSLPVFTPLSFKEESERAIFKAFKADVAIVVAYGLLLPKSILEAPRLGCYNLHASRLPRWRGAAPIQRAIMAGDDVTAATIMKMDEGLDTGPVALSEEIKIDQQMNAGQLHDILSIKGAKLMLEALDGLDKNQLELTPQSDEGIVYAKKIEKAEARIDWLRPADEIHNHIRGLSPFPGAWCEMNIGGKMQRVKIGLSEIVKASGTPATILDDQLTIACGKGAIRPIRLQRAGKGVQDLAEFLRGNRLQKGDKVK